MDALAAFAAALVALRLTGRLLARWRARRRPELAAWSASLAAFAVACAALAWGAAAGWNEAAFRLYYLCGALLTAPLLGAGSLLLAGRRPAGPAVILYAGIAVGVALAVPVEGTLAEQGIPDARDHLAVFPARLLAIAGNTAGTVAVVAVALATLRARPLGNALIVAGVLVAAGGSTLLGVGIASTAVSLAVAAALLYAGFVAPRRLPGGLRGGLAARVPPHHEPAEQEQQHRREADEDVTSVSDEHGRGQI